MAVTAPPPKSSLGAPVPTGAVRAGAQVEHPSSDHTNAHRGGIDGLKDSGFCVTPAGGGWHALTACSRRSKTRHVRTEADGNFNSLISSADTLIARCRQGSAARLGCPVRKR